MGLLVYKILIGVFMKNARWFGHIFKSDNGQAMVELAVFGAIFLMVLAALVTYGLRYDYMQKAQMRAFRTAMKIAADPDRGSASYMLMEERHIPDPVDTFGIGGNFPVVASASVTRTHRMDALSEDYDSLPTMVYDIQGERNNGVAAAPNRLVLKDAGWRAEYNILEEGEYGMSAENENRLRKYMMIYGTILGKKGGGWEPVNPSGEYDKEGYRPDRHCLPGHSYESEPDENGMTTTICTQYVIDEIRIVDPCVGNLSSYDACYDIAKRIVSVPYCTRECQETCPYAANPSQCSTDCVNYCSAKMNPPNQSTENKKGYNNSVGGAWYADDWTCKGKANCLDPEFPVLNKLFSGSSGAAKAFGLQSNMKTDITRESSLRRVENADSIETIESASWADSSERKFLINENLIKAGGSAGREQTYADPYDFTDHVVPQTFVSVDKGDVNQTWKTDK